MRNECALGNGMGRSLFACLAGGQISRRGKYARVIGSLGRVKRLFREERLKRVIGTGMGRAWAGPYRAIGDPNRLELCFCSISLFTQSRG